MYRSNDSGASWNALEFSRDEDDVELLLLAVGETNADEVWVHARGLRDDRLLRSTDGAVTFEEVDRLRAISSGNARAFAFVATGPGEAWFGNANVGLYRVAGSMVQEVDAAYTLTCLGRFGSALWACPNDVGGGHLIAKDDTGGSDFVSVLPVAAVPSIVECAPDSTVPSTCTSWRGELRVELGLRADGDAGVGGQDAGVDASPDAGGDAGPSTATTSCNASGTPAPFVAMVFLLAFRARRPHRSTREQRRR